MILKSFSHLFLVLRLQTRQAFYHRVAVIAIIFLWGSRMGLTALLYYGIYDVLGTDTINGVDVSIATSSIILYAVFSGFGSRDMYRLINEDFKSGAIEVWLNKPVSYLIMKMGQNLGKDIPAGCALILMTGVFWAIMGLPHAEDMGLRFILAVPLFLLGIILAHFLYALVGLSVVWLHDATATFFIVDKIVMIFGGAYIPIAFFPGTFRLIGEASPMGAALYVSQMFYPDFFDNYLRFISVMVFWVIATGWALIAVNKAMFNRMTVNGG